MDALVQTPGSCLENVDDRNQNIYPFQNCRPQVPLLSHSAIGILVASTPVSPGNVSPAIHKLCLEARDYAGCVQSQSGKASAPGSDTRSVIINEGAAVVEGNSCPSGYAYIGNGYCKRVKCEYNASGFNALGHDQIVAGKSKWGCKYSFWYGAGVMRLEDGALRTTINPECPSGEPKIGWKNTCETVPQGWSSPPMSETKPSSLPSCASILKRYACNMQNT